MPSLRRPAATAAALLLTLAASAACADEKPAPETDGGPTTIEVTFEGDTVTPNGERVEVDADEGVELVVQAEEAGEIHVHANPEQVLEYGPGTTTLPIALDQPGVVEVESHDLGEVVVQLQVQ